MNPKTANDVIQNTVIMFGRGQSKNSLFAALCEACAALDKQIPQKVYYGKWEQPYCPSCEQRLVWRGIDFCTDCGQKLDWKRNEQRD